MMTFFTFAALGFALVLGIGWLRFRIRARRRRVALDAYADRELARVAASERS
jgi:hypothetical protein